MVTLTEQENRLHCQKWRPYMVSRLFLSPFVQSRREMAHPVPTKGFLQLSPEAAILPGPSVETCPSCTVPPFLLAQNPSHKDIAGSNTTS